MPSTKIATCTYCGTRAALVLKGATKHELACSACGAPLHDLKMLKAGAVDAHGHSAAPGRGKKARGDVHATPLAMWEKKARSDPRKRKKKKKSLASRFFEEAFDVIEDIFD